MSHWSCITDNSGIIAYRLTVSQCHSPTPVNDIDDVIGHKCCKAPKVCFGSSRNECRQYRITGTFSNLGDFLSEKLVESFDVDLRAGRYTTATEQCVHDAPQLSTVILVCFNLATPEIGTFAKVQLLISMPLTVPLDGNSRQR